MIKEKKKKTNLVQIEECLLLNEFLFIEMTNNNSLKGISQLSNLI